MKLKHICIVAENYPSEGTPSFPFVQQLAYGLSNENVKCSVIAPQSITAALLHKKELLPEHSSDLTPEGKIVEVFRPVYVTFSDTKIDFLQKIAYGSMRQAIGKALNQLDNVDCIYCYFWHIGLTVAQVVKDNCIPLFVQASECWLTVKDFMRKSQYVNRIQGVICASGKNRDESIQAGLTDQSKTTVIVNGYRSDEFYAKDKRVCRDILKIPRDAFVVAFVGGFIERKGITQLCEALERFNDVDSIFIGSGEIQPTCRNIVFAGKVAHNEIGTYLNAADVFVLPTRAEGCCNAIIEALACGLPVISSNKSFNDEILNDECSFRIDEASVDMVYEAISKIKEDISLRERMHIAALDMAKSLTIEHRAKAIKAFVEEKANNAD